jgi:hypothetical protein
VGGCHLDVCTLQSQAATLIGRTDDLTCTLIPSEERHASVSPSPGTEAICRGAVAVYCLMPAILLKDY